MKTWTVCVRIETWEMFDVEAETEDEAKAEAVRKVMSEFCEVVSIRETP